MHVCLECSLNPAGFIDMNRLSLCSFWQPLLTLLLLLLESNKKVFFLRSVQQKTIVLFAAFPSSLHLLTYLLLNAS